MTDKERRREAKRASYHRRKQPQVLSDHLCECGCGQFTFLAPRTSAEKDWVKGEPKRFVHGHNRRRERLTPATKLCQVCSTQKPAEQFYVDKSKADGLSHACRECTKARSQTWHEENLDRSTAANHAWQKANRERYKATKQEGSRRRRARLKNVRVEKIDPWAIYKRDGGRCHICGKHVRRDAMSLDHLIPISKGGDHVAVNVRLSHISCNVKRNTGRRTNTQLLLL
jgi:5-methylcytosine-specific restriction endonuclease McrA